MVEDTITKRLELEAQLNQLEKIMGSGTRRVEYEDGTVEYSTFENMERARQDLKARINALQATPQTTRTRYYTVSTRHGIW